MYMDFINSKTFKRSLGFPEGEAEMDIPSSGGDEVLLLLLPAPP